MRIAAFDLGSNSFHLLVVEARLDGSFDALVREREMLRLGDVVARTGKIGEEAARNGVEVVARFKAIADSYHADEVIALATAAVREALDGAEFVDRVRRATGVEIEVVDGLREAQLIFTAVRASVLIDPGPALAADLGGGSLELMVGDRTGLAFGASARLGVGRLTSELALSDPVRASEKKALFERVRAGLDPILAEVAEFKPRMLIGSSGTFTSLARMAVALLDGKLPEATNQLTVPADAFFELEASLSEMTVEERSRLPGCDARRAELLPAGITVLNYLLRSTGLGELTLSEWALREGIVIDTIGSHDRAELDDDPRALRRSSMLSLCRRSNWRQPHARQVASLCLQLFDATADLHQLGPTEREILELGALSHDIGEHISRTGHDRHGSYLIENGGLRGFAPAEIRVLSLLSRFHVRGTPRPSISAFRSLEPEDRERTIALLAMLRVADALDASHAGLVQSLKRSTSEPERLVLHVLAKGDAELELWNLRRKKQLFEKTFAVELELELERSGRGDYDVAQIASGLS